MWHDTCMYVAIVSLDAGTCMQTIPTCIICVHTYTWLCFWWYVYNYACIIYQITIYKININCIWNSGCLEHIQYATWLVDMPRDACWHVNGWIIMKYAYENVKWFVFSFHMYYVRLNKSGLASPSLTFSDLQKPPPRVWKTPLSRRTLIPFNRQKTMVAGHHPARWHFQWPFRTCRLQWTSAFLFMSQQFRRLRLSFRLKPLRKDAGGRWYRDTFRNYSMPPTDADKRQCSSGGARVPIGLF